MAPFDRPLTHASVRPAWVSGSVGPDMNSRIPHPPVLIHPFLLTSPALAIGLLRRRPRRSPPSVISVSLRRRSPPQPSVRPSMGLWIGRTVQSPEHRSNRPWVSASMGQCVGQLSTDEWTGQTVNAPVYRSEPPWAIGSVRPSLGQYISRAVHVPVNRSDRLWASASVRPSMGKWISPAVHG